jgi:hypothetical protein
LPTGPEWLHLGPLVLRRRNCESGIILTWPNSATKRIS